MNINELQKLALAVSQGDPLAVSRWQQEIQKPMLRIVRRAIRRGTRVSSLQRRIREAVRKLNLEADYLPEEEQLIEQIAQEMAASLLARLQGDVRDQPRAQETIRTATDDSRTDAGSSGRQEPG